MSIKTFEKLLKFISKNYEICLPSDVKENVIKKQLILTFDDGFEDFYYNAFPLLKKHNIPAVLNVVVNCIKTDYQIWTQQLNDTLDAYAKESKGFEIQIGEDTFEYNINIENAEKLALEIFKKLLSLTTEKRELIVFKLEEEAPTKINRTKMMNTKQLKEVSDAGILIGSHSLSHPNLKIEDNQSEFLKQELSESKTQLEKILNKPVEVFAFPNGMYSELGLELAKEAGYKYLLLVDNDIAEFKHKKELKVLDRILIYSNNHYKNIFRINNFHNKIRRWLK
ncbi:polysaccharide deacetylase family protein [Brumimicrobium glaciale]|nr:polysaccharide deacetylase family protein [Brumimicrobium glaciale]